MVHNAFPKIKCIVERRSAKASPKSNAAKSGMDDTCKYDIDISISVRNHLDDSVSTSKTMRKALAAVLRFSEVHSQTTLEEYVDEITSMPDFMMRSAPDSLSVTREVYMEHCRKVAAQSTLISRLLPGKAEESMSKLYDAHESGQWGHFPPAAKPAFYLTLQQISNTAETSGFRLNLEGIGELPFYLSLDRSSPDSQNDLLAVTSRLFLQTAIVFSTSMNLECYGVMEFKLQCHTFSLAEEWLISVSGPQTIEIAPPMIH
jgi:hypothetical protein